MPGSYATSISVAPVSATSSSYVVENTAAGCPAAAQTTSYRRSQGSRYVGTGAGWSIGDTPPITWPVCSRTNSGGRFERREADGGRDLGGVDAVGARGEDQDRRAVGVEEQAVGDRADLAAERLGGQCRRVHGVGENDDLAGAPQREWISETGDRRVLGRHTATLVRRADEFEGVRDEAAAAGVGDEGDRALVALVLAVLSPPC